jgi:hypothetical protein
MRVYNVYVKFPNPPRYTIYSNLTLPVGEVQGLVQVPNTREHAHQIQILRQSNKLQVVALGVPEVQELRVELFVGGVLLEEW